MIRLTYPDYYPAFSCIAGDCTETCCAGWQVDLDPPAVERYSAAPGEIGKRLRDAMREKDGSYYFFADHRCPFLAQDGLCDIYSALGESALCDTCSKYPRFEADFGSRREIGISVSCPTAAQLILEGDSLPDLVSCEEDSPLLPNEIDADRYLAVLRTREYFFDLLRRETSLPAAFEQMSFAKAVQKRIRTRSYRKIDAIFSRKFRFSGRAQKFNWIHALYPLEPYHADWRDRLDAVQEAIPDFSRPGYYYRRMAAYFLYRHLPNAVFDGDLLTPVKLAVYSTCCTACLTPPDADFDTAMQVAIDYSREVEHSEENYRALCHSLRQPAFSVRKMCSALRSVEKYSPKP